MRKTVAFFALVFAFFTISAQGVPNGDFEQWTSDTTATGWTTLFEYDMTLTSFTYSAGERSLISHSGWSAMRIHPHEISLLLTSYRLPGLCHLGTFNTDFNLSNLSGILQGGFGVIVNNMIEGGIPCYLVPHSVKVWVRYTPGDGDQMNITVRCYSNGEIIAEGNYENGNAIDTYQQITVPVTVNDATATPDQMNIIFSCGNKEGSSLYIDDVEISYENDDDGIHEVCNVLFSAGPNPTSDVLTIRPTVGGSYHAVLTDLNGKTVWEGSRLNGDTQVDVTAFAEGVYFLKVTANGLSRTQKVVVK